jgi:DHA1 family bicyclomycin/chloramphenicol resistance-like MFS transporter
MGSYMGTASSLSLGVAPIIGGLVQQFLSWRVNFGIITVGVVLVFVCILKYLPETHHNKNPKAKKPTLWIKNYFELISSKAFVSSVLMAGLAFSGMIVYVTIAPFLMQKTLGLSPMSFGFLAIFIAIAQAIGFNVNTRILKIFSINQAMFTGVCMMLISGLLLIVLSLFGLINITSIIAVVVIYVIGTGFIYANAYAQAFTPFGHIIGFAAAMYGMLQTVIGGIASFIVALIPHYNAMVMGILFTIIAILSLLAFRVVVKCSKSNTD